jgi:hypothetical protein
MTSQLHSQILNKKKYAHTLTLFHVSYVYNTYLINIHTKLVTLLYVCDELYKV